MTKRTNYLLAGVLVTIALVFTGRLLFHNLGAPGQPTCSGCTVRFSPGGASLARGTVTVMPRTYFKATVLVDQGMSSQAEFPLATMPTLNVQFSQALRPTVRPTTAVLVLYYLSGNIVLPDYCNGSVTIQ